MTEPHYAAIKAWVLSNFYVEKIELSLLDDRISFVGKLKEGRILGNLDWNGQLQNCPEKTASFLRGDFADYVLRKMIPMRENRTIVKLEGELVGSFTHANGTEIPLF